MTLQRCKLSSTCKEAVQLTWVPGHKGIAGNETADLLARTGSEHPFTRPQLACGISELPKKWSGSGQTEIIKQWEFTIGLKTGKGTHTMILCLKVKGSTETKQRPIGLFTGH
jgi:hypothetical protein